MRSATRRVFGVAACAAAAAIPSGACARVDVGPLAAPGVPLALAEHRAATISEPHYDVSLSIPAARQEAITGTSRISFDLARAGDVVLDFAQPADNVGVVALNGADADFEVRDEHIVVRGLSAGANTIVIDFVAGDGSLNRNDDFLYTLFVPDRARVAMPVFDQPDLKGRIAWRLEVPSGWQAVANGELLGQQQAGDRTTFTFRESDPISTYVFAFAAGNFQVAMAERDGRTFRFLHRETDEASLQRNVEVIFDLHAAAIAWLEDYTGIPYPFQKFDFVAIPAFQYGGMEHPGAIFYRDRSFFLDDPATQSQLLGRASLIAHETAHMWFGNLVTMRWFDDVWMKEVFANFMASKIVNPAFPEVDHELRFLLAHYPSAYGVDRTEGANAIRQQLDNLNDAGSLYGAIIYQKAPVVMRHLELLMGEEAFRDGLREYLAAHAYANATWPDLIEVMDRRSDEDVAGWSRVWVNEPGRPTVTMTLRIGAAGPGEQAASIASLRLQQSDPRGRDLLWNQPMEVVLGYADGSAEAHPVKLRDALVDVAVEGQPAPDYVIANGDGVAYGDFVLEDGTRTWLLENLPSLPTARLRAIAWLSLWDGMLDGAVRPRAFVDLAMRALPLEDEELNVQRLVGDLDDAYWGWLDAAERAEVAPVLEQLLWQQLNAAAEPRLKAVFFGAYRGVATTPPSIERLRRLWSGEVSMEGLPLSENDLTATAEALALRGVADAETILDAQRQRIENPDRRARFDFVRPALASDRGTRDALFASLADAAHREHEPWVLAALGYLGHPLRASEAEGYIRPGLELMPEIQRTGDIFFPFGWASALLGGHRSTAAATTVREYLSAHPELAPRLRGKVLQAADHLFRVSTLQPESGGRE